MCPKAHLLRHLMLLDRLKWKWTGSACVRVCVRVRDGDKATNQSTSSHKSGLLTRTHARTQWRKKHSTVEKVRHDSTLRKQLPVKTSVHELQAAPWWWRCVLRSRPRPGWNEQLALCHVAITQQLSMHRLAFSSKQLHKRDKTQCVSNCGGA